MSDIVTSRIFTDGEKNITAAKMNDIVASSVIQPAFVGAKPSTSTVAPTDNLLVLTAAGNTYARAPFQTIIDSVNANLNTNGAIWSARLRSFQALGNNTFEVDQRNAGAASTVNGFIQDRWTVGKTGTMAFTAQQALPGTAINIPGTSFGITRSYFHLALTTAEASLAAADYLVIQQNIEGPRWRELQNDVHSFQILARSSVANLSFGVTLRDGTPTQSLTNLLTLPTANTWTLLTLPNLPIWPAGNFVNTPGVASYVLTIVLACGTTNMTTANGTWQSGSHFGAIGQSNFAASPVNSTFDIAYVSHEPGALCSNPPMDCDFQSNLDSCLRYYNKSYSYSVVPGTVTPLGMLGMVAPVGAGSGFGPVRFPKPMAKVPTVTFYNHATGAANSVRDAGGVDHTGANTNPGDSGFYTVNFTTATTGPMAVFAHYTADTGW
jgi:hypothetical protein